MTPGMYLIHIYRLMEDELMFFPTTNGVINYFFFTLFVLHVGTVCILLRVVSVEQYILLH